MTNQMINWFKNNEVLVKVNDIEYPNIKGAITEGGWYKNGFSSKILEGKSGKNQYLQINIYTSKYHQIDIEEKFLFKIVGDDYKIVKWLGWDNINLLAMDSKEEWKNMLKAIYDKNQKN
tara:strand:+ start:1688 stop:2044 length:357 start_codon:yes stop_codon:yes gene_type:complete